MLSHTLFSKLVSQATPLACCR